MDDTSISIDERDEDRLVVFAGRLTFSQNRTFVTVMNRLREEPSHHWTFDLSGVSTIDSSGLAMLLMARDVIGNGGGRLALRGAEGRVHDMLRLARFDELFPIE